MLGSHLACTFHLVCVPFPPHWAANTKADSGGIWALMVRDTLFVVDLH